MNTVTESNPSAAVQSRLLPRLSWPVIVGLLGLILPLLRPADMLVDPDTYLHIAVGRWMIEHGALPFHDPFSSSMPGTPWVPHEWLAELVYAAVYKMGGWAGVLFVTTACFGLSLSVLVRRLLVHCEPFSALIMTTMTAGLAYGHLFARPHVLAFPILVVWSAALIDARDKERAPPLWLLPLMVLWANLHGGFMFGLALALFLAGEAILVPADRTKRQQAIRQWGVFLVLTALAGLATPNGVDGFLQPFRLLGMPTLHNRFSEWLPPNLREDRELVVWILAAPALAFGLGLRLPVMRLILLLGLYYEVFQSGRHTDLLCWVAPLAVAAAIGPKLADRIRRDPPSRLAQWMARRALPGNPSGVVCAGLLALLAAIALARFSPAPNSEAPCPTAALDAARSMHLTGPVFNLEGFGGCMVFAGFSPFIDGRIEMYGDDFLAQYGKATERRGPLIDLLDRYHISWTIFAPSGGTVEMLDQLPGWHRAYADEKAVIHVRDEAGSTVPVGPAE